MKKFIISLCLPLLLASPFSLGCRDKEPTKAADGAPIASATTPAADASMKKNTPPVIDRVSLSPGTPKLRDSLNCEVAASDPEQTNLQIQYRWYLNEKLIDAEVQSSFRTGRHVRGDSIYCQAMAYDGFAESNSVNSNKVTVINSPPEIISLKESPEKPGRNTGLEFLVEAKDEDGDLLTTGFRWYHDGKELDVKGPKIPGAQLKKETFYWVFVQVSDGQETVTQHSLKIPISNSAPVITSTPPNFIKDMQEYRYQVTATDADGDSIKFKVEGAGGAQISDTGNLTWKPSPTQGGKNIIKVIAEDSDGAQSYQQFELYVGFETKQPKN